MSAALRAAMVSTLQEIDGSPDYTLDLSGTDQVYHGRPPDTHIPKRQQVWVYQTDRQYRRGGAAPLRGWEVTRVLVVEFRLPATTDSGAREDLLDAAADDLHTALGLSLLPGGHLALAGVINCSEVAFGPFNATQSSRKNQPVTADAALTFSLITDGGA